MSDPVTNVEDVEDVLSSIRRLVSDTSKEKRAIPDGEETSEESARPDALVLTSALRIDEPTPAAEQEEQVEKPTTPSELESLRRAVSGEYDEQEDEAEIARAVEDRTATWAVKPPEDYYEDEPVEPLDAPAADVEAVRDEDEAARVEAETIAEAEIEVDADHVEDAEVVSESPAPEDVSEDAQVDEPEDVQADDAILPEESSDEAEDHSDDQDAPQHTAEIHAFDPHNDDRPEQEVLDPETDDLDERALDAAIEEAVREEEEEKREASETDAILDANVGFVSEETEQPVVEKPEFAQMSDGHDEVETVGIASFLRSGGQSSDEGIESDSDAELGAMFDDGDGSTPKVDLGDMDDAVIDEEMLRDLVAEIVREELTGAVGERITRNVRKLVRREIHRAMLSREFD